MNSFIKSALSEGAIKQTEKPKEQKKKFGGTAGYYTS